MVAPEGGFEAQVTIPSGTAPGTHTINAAKSGNTPEASVQVTVAGPGAAGSSATISIINTGTRLSLIHISGRAGDSRGRLPDEHCTATGYNVFCSCECGFLHADHELHVP